MRWRIEGRRRRRATTACGKGTTKGWFFVKALNSTPAETDDEREEEGCGSIDGKGRYSNNSGEEGEMRENICKTPMTPRKNKAIKAKRDICLIPKWRSNGGQGNLHYGNSSPSTIDIINCNIRLRNQVDVSESVESGEVADERWACFGAGAGLILAKPEEFVLICSPDWGIRDMRARA
ncbi:hypothetical protein ACSQ67_020681 [Phaseolus vulgaris]